MMPEPRANPPLKEGEAARLAREIYALEVRATALPGEYDDNFRLHAGDGREFVLKIMHPSREPSFVDLQCRALEHLAEAAPHLALPRVCGVPRKTEAFASARVSDGSTRLIWMLAYESGALLAEARPHSPGLLRSLGRFLGEMDSALASFSHPSAQRELQWDLAQAGWIRGQLQHVPDPARRALV